MVVKKIPGFNYSAYADCYVHHHMWSLKGVSLCNILQHSQDLLLIWSKIRRCASHIDCFVLTDGYDSSQMPHTYICKQLNQALFLTHF